jgi:glycosyltransferase involved in cell wall biosynthesis
VARVLGEVAAHGDARVLLRHHDLPWQRRHLRDLAAEFPPRIPGALHVTINLRSRRELIARGYELVATVHNHFDLDAPLGDRNATRAALDFGDDDIVCFQPTRAIERKNVPGGVRFVTALRARMARLQPAKHVRYWLTGPAEDGYGPTLERVLARSPVPVTLGRAPSPADGYAASDLVLFPSTWEGFGNPVIESVWARRPLVVFPYPVLAEIQACGLEFFSTDDVDEVARFLVHPNAAYLDRQLRRARVSFSLEMLPAAIDAAFAVAGWLW